MINLLPATVKDELRYAKLNRQVLGYLRLIVLGAVVLGGIFGFTIFYLGLQNTKVQQDVAAKQSQIAALKPFQTQATDISSRLAAIKFIQSTQTHFSLLLSDIAKVLPTTVSLDSITLTGVAAQPVKVTVTGANYNAILAFRDALANSPRISGVDLENIQQSGPTFSADVVIGFKPGEAK